MFAQQRLDFAAKVGIVGAAGIKKRNSFIGTELSSFVKEPLDLLKTLTRHCAMPLDD